MPKHLLSFVFCHLEYFLYSLSSISVISLSCLFNCHVNLWSHWVVWPLGLNAVSQGCTYNNQFTSVAQSRPTHWPHGLQHARPPCPSPTPRVYSNSRPLSQWYHLILCISLKHTRLFANCPLPGILSSLVTITSSTCNYSICGSLTSFLHHKG